MNLRRRFDWNSSIRIHSKYVICVFIYEKSKLHSQNTIREWIQYTQRRENIAIFEFRAQSILSLRIWLVIGWWLFNADFTLTCINVIDWYGFYNNREEDSYTTMHNDRLQLIQWSNITISWISIDSIAKLSPRIQCISVIVPFGFYRIDCMILSIDLILSMHYSIDNLSLMIGKYLKSTKNEWWLYYHHQSDSDWSILSNHSIHDQQYQKMNDILYNNKTD